MITTTVICDGCGNGLTNSKNAQGYRLALIVEQLPSIGKNTTPRKVEPPFDESKHFCGTVCLSKWLESTEHGRKRSPKASRSLRPI
jgi:hypothetical protein